MIRRRFPVSPGEDVPPAGILLVDQHGHPLDNKLIVLTKSKNELELKNPNRVGRHVKVDYVNDAWWLQEAMMIKGALQPRNNEAIKLLDRKFTTIGTKNRPIRLFFYESLIESLPKPIAIASENEVIDAFRVIEEDLTCSICLQVFTEPTLLNCGHSFCKSCWSEWKRRLTNVICPLCQQNVSTELFNRPLQNIYEAMEKLKHVIKSAPTIPDPPPELIILDDDETTPPATVSPTVPQCPPVRRPVEVINDDEVIPIE